MSLPYMPCIPLSEVAPDRILALAKVSGRQGTEHIRRLLGLLPEVDRRGLFRKAGCTSIGEFASKAAEVPGETVDRVLALYGRLGHCHQVWHQLVSGRVGWTLLKLIAPYVTADNANWWADRGHSSSRYFRPAQPPAG